MIHSYYVVIELDMVVPHFRLIRKLSITRPLFNSRCEDTPYRVFNYLIS